VSFSDSRREQQPCRASRACCFEFVYCSCIPIVENRSHGAADSARNVATGCGSRVSAASASVICRFFTIFWIVFVVVDAPNVQHVLADGME